MNFEDRVKQVIDLIKDKEFTVKGKRYTYTEEQLKNDITWDDIKSNEGVGHMIFDGSYIIYPLENLIFC